MRRIRPKFGQGFRRIRRKIFSKIATNSSQNLAKDFDEFVAKFSQKLQRIRRKIFSKIATNSSQYGLLTCPKDCDEYFTRRKKPQKIVTNPSQKRSCDEGFCDEFLRPKVGRKNTLRRNSLILRRISSVAKTFFSCSGNRIDQ